MGRCRVLKCFKLADISWRLVGNDRVNVIGRSVLSIDRQIAVNICGDGERGNVSTITCEKGGGARECSQDELLFPFHMLTACCIDCRVQCAELRCGGIFTDVWAIPTH